MRLIIHAGLNKTGSSSLQTYLDQSREALSEVGVIYPDMGARGHWRIAAALSHQKERKSGAKRQGYLNRLAEQHGVENALDTLAALIVENKGSDRVILISQENFSAHKTMGRLLAFLGQVDPEITPTILAYCREPAALFQSSVQHNIKAGKKYFHPQKWVSTHNARVRGMKRLCGKNLKLRCFSGKTLVDGDVVADFRDWFQAEVGIALPPAEKTFEVNSALSAQACAILVEARADAESEVGRIANLRRLIAGYDGPASTRVKLTLPPEWQRLLRARLGTEWNAIVDRMEYSAEVKESIKVSTEPVDIDLAPGAVTQWLLGHVTPAYRDGLLQYVAKRSARRSAGEKRRQRAAGSGSVAEDA